MGTCGEPAQQAGAGGAPASPHRWVRASEVRRPAGPRSWPPGSSRPRAPSSLSATTRRSSVTTVTEVLSANGLPVRSRMRPRTAGTTTSRVLSCGRGGGVVGVLGELHLAEAAEEDDEEQRDDRPDGEEPALVPRAVPGSQPGLGHANRRRSAAARRRRRAARARGPRSPWRRPAPATSRRPTGTPCARASSAPRRPRARRRQPRRRRRPRPATPVRGGGRGRRARPHTAYRRAWVPSTAEPGGSRSSEPARRPARRRARRGDPAAGRPTRRRRARGRAGARGGGRERHAEDGAHEQEGGPHERAGGGHGAPPVTAGRGVARGAVSSTPTTESEPRSTAGRTVPDGGEPAPLRLDRGHVPTRTPGTKGRPSTLPSVRTSSPTRERCRPGRG